MGNRFDYQDSVFPPTRWVRDDNGTVLVWEHRLTLPELCLDVRMALNGSADPWPVGRYYQAREVLRGRSEGWQLGACGELDKKFDSAVKQMVDATIAMLDGELKLVDMLARLLGASRSLSISGGGKLVITANKADESLVASFEFLASEGSLAVTTASGTYNTKVCRE
jgi:hypothetical protein